MKHKEIPLALPLILFLWAGAYAQTATKGVIDLPRSSSYADKRGFADFDGDGLVDMIELGGFFESYNAATVFWGTEKDNSVGFGFEERQTPFRAPFDYPFIRSHEPKLDTGDVNGDGYADLIMTRYIDRLRSDSYEIQFAVNISKSQSRSGLQFRHIKRAVVFERSMMESLLALMDYHGVYNTERLEDRLKFDWADMDGDGRDDFVSLWRTGCGLLLCSDLEITVWYNATQSEADWIVFDREDLTMIPDALDYWTVRIQNMDTEDYDGDGLADIMFYHPYLGSDRIDIQFFLNNRRHRHPDFGLSLDKLDWWKGEEIDVDTIGFSKIDSFDVNRDGCADYVHAGTEGAKPIMSYILTDCR